MKDQNVIAKNVLVLSFSGVLVKAIGFFFRIPLGRILTASGMGDYAPAYEIYSFALAFATAGLPVAIAKMISERIAVGEYENAERVFIISRRLMAVIGVVGFLLVYSFSNPLSVLIKVESSALSIKATSFAIIVVPILASYRGYFQGNNNMFPTAVSELVEQTLRVISGLFLAIMMYDGYLSFGDSKEYLSTSQLQSRGAAGACLGTFFGAIGGLLIIRLFRKNRKKVCAFHTDSNKKILSELFRIAYPITFIACIVPIVNIIDISIVQTQLLKLGYDYSTSKAMFGELTAFASPIIGIPQVFIQSIAASILPIISMENKLHNIDAARKRFQDASTAACLFCMPCSVGLFVLSEPILALLYGSQINNNSPSINCLKIYSISFIFLSLTIIASSALQGLGRQFVATRFMLCGIVVKIILSWFLTGIPSINILGAPLGTTIAYLISSFLDYRYIKKAIGFSGRAGRYMHIALLSLFMGCIVRYVYFMLLELLGNEITLFISIVCGIFVYLSAGMIFRIIPMRIINLYIRKISRFFIR